MREEVKSMCSIVRNNFSDKEITEVLIDLGMPQENAKKLIEISKIEGNKNKRIQRACLIIEPEQPILTIEHYNEESCYIYETIRYPPSADHPHETIQ